MFTTSERLEWVEIIEPRSHERMFTNLVTGECLWEAPVGVNIKRCHNDQWWELFDAKTSRFYYYNVSSQQTVWSRPTSNADIIPLAKLQTLKQNSETSPDGRVDTFEQLGDEGTQSKDGSSTLKKTSHHAHHSHSSAASPTVSRKHYRHCQHPSHTSDGEMQSCETTSAAAGHPHAMPAAASSTAARTNQHHHHHLAYSNSGVYGYVYREPQRSLESPGLRDDGVCVDLERSKSRDFKSPESQRLPSSSDLMSRSYHSHYQSAYLPPVSPSSSDAERFFDGCVAGFSRQTHAAVGSYANMTDALAAQLTPRLMPRAFPRTNPTFVGHQRSSDGGYSTYRRINGRTSSSSSAMSTGSTLKFYDPTEQQYSGGRTGGGGAASSIQMPSMQDYPGYPTLRQKRVVNNGGFDAYGGHPTGFEKRLDGSAGQFVDQQQSTAATGDNSLTLIAPPSRIKSKDVVVATKSRRNSEPFYVNVPTRRKEPIDGRGGGGGGGGEDFAMATELNSDTLRRDSGSGTKSGRNSLEQITESTNKLRDLSVGDARDRVMADDAGSENNSVFSSTPPPTNQTSRAAWLLHASNLFHRPDYQREKSESFDQAELRGNDDRWQHQQQNLGPDDVDRNQALLRQMQRQQQQPMMKLLSESDGNEQRFLRLSGPLTINRDSDTELYSLTEFDIEEFATKHLNDHRKGFLGKILSTETVLTWSKEAIKKPIIRTMNKTVKKESCDIFRKIQLYMGDRTIKGIGADQALVDVIIKGWMIVDLRDEIFIQLCRQTTKNPFEDSLWRGLEMLCTCLSFFPPSCAFLPYLQLHLNAPIESSNVASSSSTSIVACRKHCLRRLDRVQQTGAKRGLCKPTTNEVENARKSIYFSSMFGSSLSEVMSMQSNQFPNHKLPWIQTTLSEEVLRLDGPQTEGIFRTPGDIDEVNNLKVQCDNWTAPLDCRDPAVPASLLKLWYRELYEPLIPYEFYYECVENFEDPEAVVEIVSRLPSINRIVLLYLVRFLQVFAAPQNVQATRMDVNNLSMVMAPNFLRCQTTTDPKIVFENARKEMSFVRTLIQRLDTSEMEGVV